MNTLGTGRHSELILEGPDSGSAEVSPEPCFLASCSFSLLRSDFSPSSSIASVLLYFCCFISLSRSLTLFSSPSPNKQTKIPGEGCEIFTERVSGCCAICSRCHFACRCRLHVTRFVTVGWDRSVICGLFCFSTGASRCSQGVRSRVHLCPRTGSNAFGTHRHEWTTQLCARGCVPEVCCEVVHWWSAQGCVCPMFYRFQTWQNEVYNFVFLVSSALNNTSAETCALTAVVPGSMRSMF